MIFVFVDWINLNIVEQVEPTIWRFSIEKFIKLFNWENSWRFSIEKFMKIFNWEIHEDFRLRNSYISSIIKGNYLRAQLITVEWHFKVHNFPAHLQLQVNFITKPKAFIEDETHQCCFISLYRTLRHLDWCECNFATTSSFSAVQWCLYDLKDVCKRYIFNKSSNRLMKSNQQCIRWGKMILMPRRWRWQNLQIPRHPKGKDVCIHWVPENRGLYLP